MAKQETTIQLRASDRFKRLAEFRAAELGKSLSEYIKQAVLKADPKLEEFVRWDSTSTDDVIAVWLTQTQQESMK